MPWQVTQMDLFNRLLDTTPLNSPQFGLALGPAVLLLVLWERGKLLARRREADSTSSERRVTLSAAD